MNRIIRNTESLCPICFQRIAANIVEKHGDLYIKKRCRDHGTFETLLWRDAELYKIWESSCVHADLVKKYERRKNRGCPYDCGLCSEHEGGTCTAIIQVTNDCNMNCPVCFSQAGEIKPNDPDLETISGMYQRVLAAGGICSVQLSGGEPTLRNDLPEIIQIGKKLGFNHIQVNTNGLRISKDYRYLERLKTAGADLIYLQFDGTREKIYQFTRGRNMLDVKKLAIDHCEKAGIGVLLVPVIIRGINDDNLGDILSFAKSKMPVVKGIHFQPASHFGRFPYDRPSDDTRITLPDIIKGIITQTDEGLEMKHFIPRKRFDSHCSFSSLFFLDNQNRLQAATKNENETGVQIQERMESFRNNKSIDDNRDYFTEGARIFTEKHWRLEGKRNSEKLSTFQRIRDYRLTLTGMPFQDIWNLDLQRLKGCCVHVVGIDRGLIPLCAYYLTNAFGSRLYGVAEEDR